MPDKEFYVRFWGVRGSIPVSGKKFNEFGGSTPCIEVGCGGRIVRLFLAAVGGESLLRSGIGRAIGGHVADRGRCDQLQQSGLRRYSPDASSACKNALAALERVRAGWITTPSSRSGNGTSTASSTTEPSTMVAGSTLQPRPMDTIM